MHWKFEGGGVYLFCSGCRWAALPVLVWECSGVQTLEFSFSGEVGRWLHLNVGGTKPRKVCAHCTLQKSQVQQHRKKFKVSQSGLHKSRKLHNCWWQAAQESEHKGNNLNQNKQELNSESRINTQNTKIVTNWSELIAWKTCFTTVSVQYFWNANHQKTENVTKHFTLSIRIEVWMKTKSEEIEIRGGAHNPQNILYKISSVHFPLPDSLLCWVAPFLWSFQFCFQHQQFTRYLFVVKIQKMCMHYRCLYFFFWRLWHLSCASLFTLRLPDWTRVVKAWLSAHGFELRSLFLCNRNVLSSHTGSVSFRRNAADTHASAPSRRASALSRSTSVTASLRAAYANRKSQPLIAHPNKKCPWSVWMISFDKILFLLRQIVTKCRVEGQCSALHALIILW